MGSARAQNEFSELLINSSEFVDLPEIIQHELSVLIFGDSLYLNPVMHKNAKTTMDMPHTRPEIKQKSSISRSAAKPGTLLNSLNQTLPSYTREKLDSIEFYEPVPEFTYDSLNTEIIEYKKDANGFIDEIIFQSMDLKTLEWDYTRKTVFHNDANGRPVERYEMLWNGTNWQNSVKTVYEFDPNGNLINNPVYNWNTSDEVWILANRTENLYDDNNRILWRKYYDVQSHGEGVVSNKSEYTYNENGAVILYLFYICP